MIDDKFPQNYFVMDDGCWMWLNGKDKHGFAKMFDGTIIVDVGQYMYGIHNGQIPKGHVVIRTCNNRLCINPDHLTTGSWGELKESMKKSEQVTEDQLIKLKSQKRELIQKEKAKKEYKQFIDEQEVDSLIYDENKEKVPLYTGEVDPNEDIDNNKMDIQVEFVVDEISTDETMITDVDLNRKKFNELKALPYEFNKFKIDFEKAQIKIRARRYKSQAPIFHKRFDEFIEEKFFMSDKIDEFLKQYNLQGRYVIQIIAGKMSQHKLWLFDVA